MKKIFTREVKIALVAIVGVIILFAGMTFLKGLNIFESGAKYYIHFSNINGLSSSAPIYADGYKIGTVKSITYDYNNSKDIVVEAEVDKNMRIPKGSTAEIVTDLMGNIQINILLANNPRERIMPGENIQGAINGGAMDQIKGMIPSVEKMMPKLDSILTSLNLILADPSIRNTLHNAEAVTNNLTTTTIQLNKLMATLNKSVPGMVNKANGVLDNTQVLTGKLAEVDVEGTMQQVNTTLANVKAFTDKLNNNQSTLGLLMNDASLYNNLNSTVRSADSLVTDLKAHPKRYVHFSLFGRKDK